jgi:hypothetical protein
MQERAGKIHVSRVRGGVQQIQDISDSSHMGRLDAATNAGFEQQSQPFVPEAPDHR